MAFDQYYYPSLAVNLRLRFDEAYLQDASPDPVTSTDAANATIEAQKPSNRPTSLEAGAAGTKGGQDELTIVCNRVPISAEVELPGYIQAGTFRLTLPWRDLPIDPRLIRACGVEIYLGTVSSNDFSSGIGGALNNGARRSTVQLVPDNLLLIGAVDDYSSSFSGSSSTITLSGRDLRGVLHDSPANPALFTHLKLDQPINKVVEQILAKHPLSAKTKITVSADPKEWSDPAEGPQLLSGAPVLAQRVVPSPATKDNVTAVRVSVGSHGAPGGQVRSTPAGGSGQLSYWDLITRYCYLVGAIPYFKGEALLIRPAKSLYDLTKPGVERGNNSPFAGGAPRSVKTGDPEKTTNINFRRMVYGRDIDELHYERKQGGIKNRTIECISINTSAKTRDQRLLIGRWGPNGNKAPTSSKKGKTSVSPSGAQSEAETLRIPTPGYKDQKTLENIAHGIYQAVARGELGGSCSTKNLASFGGDGSDPDLLGIRPGDPVEFLVDTRRLSTNSPLVSEYTDSYRRSPAEQEADIATRLGGNAAAKQVARAIVASSQGKLLALQTVFRTNNVKYNWSTTQGIGISFDFQNYIEARGDGVASGPNTKATTSTAAGRPVAKKGK